MSSWGEKTMKIPFARFAAAIACAVLAVQTPAEARFLQVDPVGYKEQTNLYAYVGNDPVHATHATGMRCGPVGGKDGGAIRYSSHIDQVAIVDRQGHVRTRDPTAGESRRFIAFNRRYTDAVNRLARDPNQDRTARVATIDNGRGSFETTVGKAAAAMAGREVVYTDRISGGLAMETAGGIGVDGADGYARTYVYRDGLSVSRGRIVHEMGLHGTLEENNGGLQRRGYPLAGMNHHIQYDDAACALLGEQG